jgi:hypothetical protein
MGVMIPLLQRTAFSQRKRFFFISAFIVFNLCGCSLSPTPTDSTLHLAQTLNQQLSLLDSKYGFKGWGSFRLGDHPILLVNLQSQDSYLLEKNQVRKVNYSQLPPGSEQQGAQFNITQWRGAPTLILFTGPDKTEEEQIRQLLYLAVHEGFHAFYQDPNRGFVHKPSRISRGQIYPLLIHPRYYRYEMFLALTDYLTTQNKRHLNRLSGWYFKWVKNFPEEADNYTDRIEGSAQFYTNQALTFIHNHKNKSQVSEYDYFKEKLQKPLLTSKWLDLDREAYLIGPLSGLVLDHLQATGWQTKVDQGKSPLEVLAYRYKPYPTSDNNDTLNEFVQISVDKMQAIDQSGVLDSIIKNLSANQSIRVVLTHNADTNFSSFNTDGFYRSLFDFTGVKDVQMVALTSPLIINLHQNSLKIEPPQYWVMAQSTPCSSSSGGTILFYPTDQVIIGKHRIQTLSAPTINWKIRTVIRQDDTTWVCLN